MKVIFVLKGWWRTS
ncbi:trp operon leader peptide [Escherichia coli]|nr:trp operon leader peptide [Escherichia coli]QMD87912.1 trp operon leader peptide [Escherichia coli]HAX1982016.1 trp operon leader peptide [Escherichia coli]HDP1459509.1 trp operon leader peptide [Escherichia coli]HDP1506546.1 trp operon leader peptide [Escherichia coli]